MSTSTAKEWFLKELGKEWLMYDILIKHWPANMFCQTYIELADILAGLLEAVLPSAIWKWVRLSPH